MKKGHIFYSFLLLAGFISLHSHAYTSFGVGLSIGSGGYGNYYPSSGGFIGGGGYGGIGGVCGNACSMPPQYMNACQYNPYTPYLGGGSFSPMPMPGMGGGLGVGGGQMGNPFPGPIGTIGGGNGWGAPGMGGGIGGGIGGIGGGIGGGFANPMLPPPQPYLPPHIALGGMGGMNGASGGGYPGWGGGFGSYPMPGMAPTPGCVPCMAGYNTQPLYPVAGGPVMYQNGMNPYYGGGYSTGAPSGMYRGIAGGGYGGTTVINMRSRNAWEMEDTGEIVFNAGLGMSSMLTNVYPVAFPRNEPTLLPSGFFNSGSRNSDFWARPTH